MAPGLSRASFLRQRLALSIITQKPILIRDIRQYDKPKSGIREYEANLLRLLEKLTNGSIIRIQSNGCSLEFSPGTLIGGNVFHECCNERDIAYYLELITWVCPFFKKPISLTLTGVTNGSLDQNVDIIRLCSLPLLKRFGLDEGLSLTVVKRGASPNGGGKVLFTCPIVKNLNSIQLLDLGKVLKVRGIAFTTRVAPTFSNRIIEGAKSILLNYLPDIFITQDHSKAATSGNSPGFGICLTAETTTGVVLSAEANSVPKHLISSSNLNLNETSPNNELENQLIKIETAEEMGNAAAKDLLNEIFNGGCVTSTQQALLFIMMAASQNSVSKVIISKPTDYSIQFLRHIQQFMGVVFKISCVASDLKSTQEFDNQYLLNSNLSNNGSEFISHSTQSLDPISLPERFYFSCVGGNIHNLNKTST